MRSHAVLLPLTDLHSRRGKLDERSQYIRLRAAAAACVPKLFPHFVRFPIIAGIE